jgi:hypothetical protein
MRNPSPRLEGAIGIGVGLWVLITTILSILNPAQLSRGDIRAEDWFIAAKTIFLGALGAGAIVVGIIRLIGPRRQ